MNQAGGRIPTSREQKSQARITVFVLVLLLLIPTVLAVSYTGNYTGNMATDLTDGQTQDTDTQAPDMMQLPDIIEDNTEEPSSEPSEPQDTSKQKKEEDQQEKQEPVENDDSSEAPDQEQPEEQNPCDGVVCETYTTTCPDGFVSECTGVCNPETGVCSACTPDCKGHESLPEENKTCQESWNCTEWSECRNGFRSRICTDMNSCGTLAGKPKETEECEEAVCNLTCGICEEPDTENCICIPITPCCGNGLCEENETCDIDCAPVVPEQNATEPETGNETENKTGQEPGPPGIGLPEINETINETNKTEANITLPEINETINQTEKQGEPAISITLNVPEKAVRGENIRLTATAENTGTGEARNTVLTWYLPLGFSIIEGSNLISCGNLQPGESCESTILVASDYSTGLGINTVRVMVEYE